MTREQENAIEALSLRDGGFAAASGGSEVVKTREGTYIVDPEGNASGPIRILPTEGFRRLMAGVYGPGQTP